MPELIDRYDAIRRIEDDFCSECDCEPSEAMCRGCEYLYCMDILKQMPTIEPGVRRGEWIIKSHGTYRQLRAFCSVCGKHSGIGGIESNQRKPYCPNCGARMDGGADNG